MSNISITVVMPCLNEARTVGVCVEKALSSIRSMGVPGEVIVADNGSTDGSVQIATTAGAKVVHQPVRGYGAAIAAGIDAASGAIIVMGDADDSYDWGNIAPLVDGVMQGNDLVMGNRFAGRIEPGAMPLLHRYLGNPVLSYLGRLFFKAPVGDFHCGIRAFSRTAILKLQLQTTGMEFASEMIVKAALHGLRIAEVPVVLSPDGRGRPPHLRTWRDGWRHLRFLLLYSPRWLFLLPGTVLFLFGLIAMLMLGQSTVFIGRFGLDIHSMAYAGAATLLGFQMILFAVFTKVIGEGGGWLPHDPRLDKVLASISLESGLVVSAILFAAGFLLTLGALGTWSESGYGSLDPRVTMRWVVPAVTALALAGETALGAFFLEALRMQRPRPATLASKS
ncbi:MAG: glycosyltransferase family 2 protein [Prolixibacteraceae bacterium]|nr:glycosyltransferase family 2 protein [Burkholderiales bacterium]